jgi:subtilase family serine protease
MFRDTQLSRHVKALAVLFMLEAGCMAQSFLTFHVPQVVRNERVIRTAHAESARVLRLSIVLPLRDSAGLKAFLANLYDPSNPSYRQFLTVQQFIDRFGPTQNSYDAVLKFATASGLTVVGGTRDGMEIQVSGTISAIESAFHVTINTFQHPTENRTFYAPTAEPTTNLTFPLWHVAGLDNYSIPRPLFVKKTDYAKAHGITPQEVVANATTGSGPSSAFLGSDMRAAYYGGTALTGAGQNLGLLEFAGTDLADLSTYFSTVHQVNQVPVTLLSTDGTSTSCVVKNGCDDTEQTLDMTQAIGMAPGLASLVMYIGSTDTAILAAMTSHNPLPATVGCSWSWTPSDPSILDPYFERMSAQGQTFFTASGDSSTWSATNNSWPADDTNVIAVGGTDLVTASAGGAWSSETAWSDSGGGVSPNGIAIPSWQQTPGLINTRNGGSTTLRNGPDVSANANFTFYVCADQSACTANTYGGTSFAAPMWAGYAALLNQQLALNNQGPIGFLNRLLYGLAGSGFHDITSGTSGSYSAVAGYDLVTGWGSPNGVGLITGIISARPTPPTSLTATLQ